MNQQLRDKQEQILKEKERVRRLQNNVEFPKRDLKRAVKHTTKDLLNNIFRQKKKNLGKIVLNDQRDEDNEDEISNILNDAVVPKRRQANYNEEDENAQKYQGYQGESDELQPQADKVERKEESEKRQDPENGEERREDHETLLIETLDKTNEANAKVLEEQYERTIATLENTMREDRNVFQNLATKVEDLLTTKDHSVDKVTLLANENNEALKRQFQQTAQMLQNNINQDRQAFANFTQKSLEEKVVSDRMLQSSLESSNENLARTLRTFLDTQNQDANKEKQELITKLQNDIQKLQEELKKQSEEKLTESFVNYHLEHARKFDSSLQMISTLENQQIARIKQIEQNLQSTILSSLNDQMIKVHQQISKQIEDLQESQERQIQTIRFLKSSETQMEQTLAGVDALNKRVSSLDVAIINKKISDLETSFFKMETIISGKISDFNNQIDSQLQMLYTSIVDKIKNLQRDIPYGVRA
jgi:hypothetical protein